VVRLRDVAPAAIAHAGAYADLLGAAAREWRQELRQRAAYGLLGISLLWLTVSFGSGWAVLTIWSLPNRQLVAAGVFALLVVSTWLLLRRASRPAGPRPHATALRSELSRDRELLAELRERSS